MRNALSIDVEEYFQVGAFETVLDRADWDRLESRVEQATDRILALLADRKVHATFFVLGWIAERHPALIARIAAGGHEVASHGWDHARVFTLTADSFREDLRRARGTIEDAAGTAVTGYRAPSFSIDQRTPWAHPVLAEEGYAYSSSVAPIAHDHYGWREAPRFAWHPVAGSPLIELPVTTVELAGRRFAAAGGGFFRLYPYALSRWAVQRLNANDHRPAVVYLHPWEVDPDQPRIAGAPLKSRLRHYARLDAMEAKLARLVDDFAWDRVDAVIAAEAA
jgi:polysaccharide deacetylase family protein (PEP-CTERM system associated)